MNEKKYKKLWIVTVIVLFIAITPLAYLGANMILNSLILHKIATTNDYTNFWGGIIGSIIGGLIAFAVLFVTIRNNNKKQKEQIELQNSMQTKDANLKIALKTEDNLNRKMEVERKIISEAYNNLEKFVYMSMKITPSYNDYNEMKNNLINLHGNFSSSVNLIRFNSEIFYDKSKCEGCESCNLKTYGLLVKDAMTIQKEITEIEKECNSVISYFETMLNLSSECSRLIEPKKKLEEYNTNYNRLIEIKNMLLHNPITPEDIPLIKEITNLHYKLDENIKQISLLDVQIDDMLKLIRENNTLARTKANEIYVNQKGKFATCIYKYFDSYNIYIQECVYSIEQKGKKRNYKCAKLDFEKNHGVGGL